jgi:hypothetical protein
MKMREHDLFTIICRFYCPVRCAPVGPRLLASARSRNLCNSATAAIEQAAGHGEEDRRSVPGPRRQPLRGCN